MLDHNHLVSPNKAKFFRCYKNINDVAKRRLDRNDRSGIRVNKNFNSLVVEIGQEKNCQNFIATFSLAKEVVTNFEIISKEWKT
jgi:hypothetical protein